MDSYNIEAIDKFPKEMMRTIKTPAGNHLFKVDKVCVKLCERDKIILHRLVEKILFLSKCAQPYIYPIISFLTTRVKIQTRTTERRSKGFSATLMQQ